MTVSQAQAEPCPQTLPFLELLDLMLLARESDKREAILFRQGRAKFQLPGAGHEGVAAIAYALEKEDVVYPYYRDRALMLARGTSLHQLALDYFAKAAATSGGRQMASHYCDKDNNMASCATPTGLQCLPAVGTAWGFKLAGKKRVVVCCIGEAATRQGEFYEALCFALQESLPVIFVVEDNGYGVSTATKGLTPYVIKALSESHCTYVDGRDVEAVYQSALEAVDKARFHNKPAVLWIELDRLMSHTSSDDHRLYRSPEELQCIKERDPLARLAAKLQTEGYLTPEAWARKCENTQKRVDATYETAEKSSDPEGKDASTHILSGKKLKLSSFSLPPEPNWTMAKAVNETLKHLLSVNDKIIMFGEDICDPKGGVFGLTKGLSSHFPDRVFNSPLAEATICGVASGLCQTGFIPIFELQFIDFVGPAFNQIVNQIATLRWRTLGRYTCPLVILAPCGGYLGCGGPWHSQTNEAWFAHAPGLKLAMPSTPWDAAEVIASAAAGDDPVIVFLPKNLFFKPYGQSAPPSLFPEQARIRKQGKDVTLLAWGNSLDIALGAAEEVEAGNIHAEVIDLRFLAPWDQPVITSSVRKTGRLLIVQEDNHSCSLGQSLVCECVSQPEVWQALKSPPHLISRKDVHIGFHPALEAAVLPHKEDVIRGIHHVMGTA